MDKYFQDIEVYLKTKCSVFKEYYKIYHTTNHSLLTTELFFFYVDTRTHKQSAQRNVIKKELCIKKLVKSSLRQHSINFAR